MNSRFCWLQDYGFPKSRVQGFGSLHYFAFPKSLIEEFGFPKSWTQELGSLQDFSFQKSLILDLPDFKIPASQNPEFKMLAHFKILAD